MSGYGTNIQIDVYQKKVKHQIPVRFEELEKQAREKLKSAPYYYVAGGAGSESTMRANLRAFDRWQIVPRMLCDVKQRDLSVSLLGETFPYPVMLAPVGVQTIFNPKGELASARAAAAMKVPFISSTASTHSMEEVAAVLNNSPRWYQLYWSNDSEIAASMVRRAEASGYSAIVVTLDTNLIAWRENDIENAYLPFLEGEGIGNWINDPVFCAKLQKPPHVDMEAAIYQWAQVASNPGITWKDLEFLRSQTNLPILLKGILHSDDSKLALQYGVDGIIVSNHGGRQVDGAIGALDALPKICEIVQGRIPVLFDSGIRRGADVVKALALGASAVLLGRPYVYGLALAGEQGVRQVIRNLIADIDITMALSGIKSIAELDRSILVAADPSLVNKKEEQQESLRAGY
jgi:isopentenyl diphosphate isomerase/L-lactate dehydrogenase-like FMN-dependent dehydrogenase